MKYTSYKIIWHSLKWGFAILLLFTNISLRAQFAPPAGQDGSTAIHADSNIFVAWANNCEISRGFMDISNPQLGNASFGTEESAFGKADNDVVSLGDGGSAVIYFDSPIVNGDGFDFAVFENGFQDDFLELAFVEISTDGINYQRISNTSNTQITNQVTTFGTLDASLINNLAGKYRIFFGTPFDISEVENTDNLDLQNIRYIKIIDVVGSLDNEFSTYDSHGNKVNDPWPTPFEPSGFDLDAVGVIHDLAHLGVENLPKSFVKVYPNPFSDIIQIENITVGSKIVFMDINSRLILSTISGQRTFAIHANHLPKGIIILKIIENNTTKVFKLIHN